MKLLLDTAPFLWMIFDQKNRFSKRALKQIESDETELYLSAVSTWEISIKAALGKLDIQKNHERWLPDIILEMGLKQVPISMAHTLALARMPILHKDPFDRLLIAQAGVEGLVLLSPDHVFKKYKIPLLW